MTTQVVGQSTIRSDGAAKVSGAARYTGDLAPGGLLHAAILRSSVPSGRIARLDLTRARQLPGVRAAICAADAPRVLAGWVIQDTPLFARDRVRYEGEPLAAVAADSAAQARAAVAAIELEIAETPAVADFAEALAPGAPLLHPELAEYACLPGIALNRSGNVAAHWEHATPGVEAAFERAHQVVEDHFVFERQYHAYLEPKSAVASYGQGRFVIQSGHQYIFNLRDRVAQFLAVRPSDVRVEGQVVGGGFGGKLDFGPEPYAALLSQSAGGRPVKLVFTRDEDLLVGTSREGAAVTVRSALDAAGRVLGRELFSDHDNGAYSGEMPMMAGLALLLGAGCYRVPEARLRFRLIYTNTTPTGAFRGVSGVPITTAIEQHMDHLAEAAGVDRREYRLRELLRDGETLLNGQVLDDVHVAREGFEAVERTAPWISLRDRKKPLEGVGVACCVWLTNPLPGSASVKLNEDGTAHVVTGGVDIGTGALTQGVTQIVAEVLGLDPAQVYIAPPDTDTSAYDGGAQGSRTTRAVGRAAQRAAIHARQQVLETAADLLGTSPADLDLLDGFALARGDPGKRLPLTQVLAAAAFGSGAIVGTGRGGEDPVAFDPERAAGLAFPALPTPTYHVHLAQVTVDPVTGAVRVVRYVVAQEVGTAINPAAVAGQIQGGVCQGIGYALYERLRARGGRYLERSLKDVGLPLAVDVPDVEIALLEHPDRSGPFGAKGAAEPSIVLAPAVIGNAVADAIGERIHQIPITPEAVLAALERRGVAP